MTAAELNKRRVSYVIPAPAQPPPWLELPPFGTAAHAEYRPYPLVTPKAQQPNANGTPNGSAPATPIRLGSRNPFAQSPASPPPAPSAASSHPRHRLGVSCLALDTSTVLHGAESPGGILYTGGRDGLVASWELHVPHVKRRGRCYRPVPGRGTGTRVRWERVGDGGADWDDEAENNDNNEDNDDHDSWGSSSSDDDDLVALDTNGSGGRKRQLPFECKWEVDHDAIKRQPPPTTTFRESVQTHTDWVNDMVLCNMNQTVITASSDRTIRAWSPHAAEAEEELAVPALIGHHTDYVRSLAFARQAGVLFSGALDRDISVWDVASPRPNDPVLKVRLSEIDDHNGSGLEGEWGSIYALGVDPMGQTLAAGTPERVVRLWDPRAGDRSVTKLIGHTECVRSIVISEDGRYMLTGSSDTTVKLWSIGERRCLHTFNHHTSSVWALHSNHPNLERFYSGSRDGHLCVVDVEQCGDMSEGECVVLAREGDGLRPGDFESKTGDEAIRSITSMDDEYVWTATSSSDVHRWRDIGRRVGRMDLEFDGASYGDEAAQPLFAPGMSLGSAMEQPMSIIDGPLRNRHMAGVDGEDELSRVESRDSRTITFAPNPIVDSGTPPPIREGTASPPSSPPTANTLHTSVRERLSISGGVSGAYRRTTLSGASIPNSVMSETPDEPILCNEIPYESLVCLGLPDSPYSFGFSGMAHSTASLASGMRARSPEDSPEAGLERPLNPRAAARRAFESREVAAEAKPLRTSPDAVILGCPGLIRSLVLNDRLHVLTLDTTGEVAVWHLVRGECLGRFAHRDLAEALELERGVTDVRTEIKMHPTEVLELVQTRIEGKNCVLPWCQVDTKVGQITVHLEGDRVFAAEILSEEIGVEEDSRPLNVGKVVLGNLFYGLIKAEEIEVQSAASSSPTTQSSSLPSISRSPAPTFIPIDRVTSPRHRQRALSSASLSGGMTPSINIAGLATRAERAAIRPDAPLGQSAPSSSGAWLTPGGGVTAGSGPTSLLTGSARTPFGGSSVGSGTPVDSVARDYFSVRKPDAAPEKEKDKEKEKGTGAVTPTPTTPASGGGGGLLSKKFKGFGKKKNTPEPQMTTVVESKLEEPPEDKGPKLSDRDRNQLLFLDALRSRTFAPPSTGDVPRISIPDATAVIISEQSHADGAYLVTYRSQVSSTERDMEPLEMNSPFWLLNFLFANVTPEERRPPKIPLVLVPEGQAPGNGIGLKAQASRTARVRGVIEHLQMALQREEGRERSMSDASAMSGVPASASSNARAEDTFELLCGDLVADPDMKVATLKHYHWRGGMDMVLHWRRK